MKKFKLVAMLLTSVSISSFASGFGAGNGGGVQYCKKEQTPRLKYQAYDLQEISNHIIEERRRDPILYDGVTMREEYLKKAIDKVRKTSTYYARSIERALDFYYKNVKDHSSYNLQTVNDVDLNSLDKNCEYRQVVNWIEPDEVEEKFGTSRLLILRNDSIYDQLDPLNQAVLDFHEAIYAIKRVLIKSGGNNSSFVRMFTGQVFAAGEVDRDIYKKLIGEVFNLEEDKPNTILFISDTEKSCKGTGGPKVVLKNEGGSHLVIASDYLDGYIFSGSRMDKIEMGAKKVIYLMSNRMTLSDYDEFENYVVKEPLSNSRFDLYGGGRGLFAVKRLGKVTRRRYFKERDLVSKDVKLSVSITYCGEERSYTLTGNKKVLDFNITVMSFPL